MLHDALAATDDITRWTAPASELEQIQETFLQALLAASSDAARAVIDCALSRGTPPASVYLDVIAPALHEIGRGWEDGRVSVAREHLATAMTEALMVDLSTQLKQPREPGRSAVVGSVDGDRHVVGARMVADFLEAQGWEVFFLGASTPSPTLRALVDDLRPSVVALSVTLPSQIFAAADAIDALVSLDPAPTVAIGGWALETPASRILCSRADIATRDIETFMHRLSLARAA